MPRQIPQIMVAAKITVHEAVHIMIEQKIKPIAGSIVPVIVLSQFRQRSEVNFGGGDRHV